MTERDPVAAADTPEQIAAAIDDPGPGARRPSLIERRLVGPLLEVVEELDPRLPGVAHLALGLVDHMLVSSIQRAFRWIWLSAGLFVFGVIALIGTSGWTRFVTLLVIVLPAGAITSWAVLLRASMLRTARAVTGSYARPDQHQAIAAAVRRGKLPTGPVSLGFMIVRTVVRGPRREVRRIHALARDLAREIGDVEGGDESAAPEAPPAT